MLGEKNMTLSNLNDIFELFIESVMGCIMSIILAGVIKFVKNMRDNIAKFSNLRNRKIIDSVIVGKNVTESWDNGKEKMFYYWIQLFFIIITLVCLYVSCRMELFFINIKEQENIRNCDLYIVLGALLGGVIVCRMVKKLYIKWYIFILIVNVYGYFLFSVSTNNQIILLITIGMTAITWNIIVKIFIDKIWFKKRYKNTFIKISEIVRLIALEATVFVSLKNTFVFTYVSYIWMIIVTIEYIVSLFSDLVNDADILLCFEQTTEKSKSDIIQCKNGKVLYTTEDGIHKFVAVDEIKYITYEVPIHKFKKKIRKVLCTFKEGEKTEFHRYRYIGTKWISFSRLEQNTEKIYIYNLEKIKELKESKKACIKCSHENEK